METPSRVPEFYFDSVIRRLYMIRKLRHESFILKFMSHVSEKCSFGSQFFYFFHRLFYVEVGPVGFVPQRAEYQ